MPIPNLLHPVPIVLQQLDTSNTVYDDDYREPVQQASRVSNTTLSGQVKWIHDDAMAHSRGGVRGDESGYVLFRYTDLAAASVTLRQNDRFITIGGVETDVYITRVRPMGHYPDQGGPTMVRAYFRDRQPSRQRLGEV